MLKIHTTSYVVTGEPKTSFHKGQQATLGASITLSGEPADPTGDLVLQVLEPDGKLTSYSLLASQIEKTSTGEYHKVVDLKKSPRLSYRWTAKGAYSGTSGDMVINVDPSKFSSV